MSEYQYYEFLAIDRPLTAAQVAAVRQISTRADITPTRFVNEYHFGNFKGDAKQFLKLYFDAHVYVANGGSRRFAFRVPRDLVNPKGVEAYAHDQSLDVTPAGDWLILDIDLNAEPGDWDEVDGHGWMASLAPLRAEVIAGDLRPLYLGWLSGVQLDGPPDDNDEADPEWDDGPHDGAEDDDTPAPPVPPGMGRPSAAQQALVDFLRISPDLLEVAAADSPPPAPPFDLAAKLKAIPAAQKDRWLTDLLGGGDPMAAARIRRQLQGDANPPAATATGRTVGQLRAAWGERVARRRRERQAAAAAAKRKRDAAEAAAREQRLAELAGRVTAAWRDVNDLIGQKNRDGYGKAVALMLDLRTVADRQGRRADFDRQLSDRLRANARRLNLMEAARKAGLVADD